MHKMQTVDEGVLDHLLSLTPVPNNELPSAWEQLLKVLAFNLKLYVSNVS
jgi:hypothetical protein